MRAPALSSKLSLNWTGLFQILQVGPSISSPNGHPVGDTLLYLEIPSQIFGSNSKPRVLVMRCEPCVRPDNTGDRPVHLPAGLTEYFLTRFAAKSPPFHVTADDVGYDGRVQRVELDSITAHCFVCGRGGNLSVMYEARWTGLSRRSWERGANLHFSVLLSCDTGPDAPFIVVLDINSTKGCGSPLQLVNTTVYGMSDTSGPAMSSCHMPTFGVISLQPPVVSRVHLFGSRIVLLVGGLE